MTCKQLGGACEMEFRANSFEEMVAQSKKHGMAMYQKGDEAHIKVMNQMKENMKTQSPEAMKAWFDAKREEFNALPEHE